LVVASVTTDLAGFGRYFCTECGQSETPGIYVLKRLNKGHDEVVEQLVDVMSKYASLSKEDRIANMLDARKIAAMADWKIFIKKYIEAHNLAIDKVYK